jgi:hypothetical protein
VAERRGLEMQPEVANAPVAAAFVSERAKTGEWATYHYGAWGRLPWCAAIVAGFLQTWAQRHNVSSDGISYLDIATNCARGDWHSLVNAYWSPLYPSLLGVTLRITNPSPLWESTVAHLLNFGVFLFSFGCFEFLLGSLLKTRRQRSAGDGETTAIPDSTLRLLGGFLFVYLTLMFIDLGRVQPDILVAGLVYLAAGALVWIEDGAGGWATYAGLGAILGLGYLAKTVMFPLAFVFLGCALLGGGTWGRSVPRVAVALATFLLVSGPFVWALSREKGRLTYGDVGKIAYAEYVNGATRTIHWQGGPPGNGTPVHPTRMLMAEPLVFEFGGPVKGTYPPWYDASYWYEGITPKLSVRNQLRAIRYTIQEYSGIVPYMSGILAGVLALAALSWRENSWWRGPLNAWPLWVPGCVALGLYGLVYIEARYVMPFFLLIWIGLFAAWELPRASGTVGAIRAIALGVALTCGLGVVWLAGRNLFRVFAPLPFVDGQVAQSLEQMGIKKGQRVASVGYGLGGYWAHMAGVKIVAEVPPAGLTAFWDAPPEVRAEVFRDFAQAGAAVVITDQTPPPSAATEWRQIGATSLSIHTLGPHD